MKTRRWIAFAIVWFACLVLGRIFKVDDFTDVAITFVCLLGIQFSMRQP